MSTSDYLVFWMWQNRWVFFGLFFRPPPFLPCSSFFSLSEDLGLLFTIDRPTIPIRIWHHFSLEIETYILHDSLHVEESEICTRRSTRDAWPCIILPKLLLNLHNQLGRDTSTYILIHHPFILKHKGAGSIFSAAAAAAAMWPAGDPILFFPKILLLAQSWLSCKNILFFFLPSAQPISVFAVCIYERVEVKKMPLSKWCLFRRRM